MSIHESLTGLRKLAMILKPLSEVCDELERVGGLEVRESELRREMGEMSKAIELKKKTAEELDDRLPAMREKFEQRIRDENEKARKILADASEKGDKLIEDAKVVADRIRKNAEADIITMNEAKAKVKEELEKEVKNLRATQAEQIEVRKKIEEAKYEARERARKFMEI